MRPRQLLAALAIALAGCSTTLPPDLAAIQSDAQCQANRSWFPQRAAEGVWDDCRRQLGEAWCRKCLVE